VSHDRYFISRVANRIVELKDGELVLYRGDYAYYQAKKREESEAAEATAAAAARAARQAANRLRQKDKQKARQQGSQS